MWKDFDEPRLGICPVFKDPGGPRAAGEIAMSFEQGSYAIHIVFQYEWFQVDAGLVAAP